MIKFETMKEEYSVYHIKGDTFVKVLSYDKDTGATNVDIFYKVNDKFKPVTQYELPNNIVNIIATKQSEEMSEYELNEFKKFIEKQNIINKNEQIENEKIIFGKILHNHYILSKSPIQDFYRVSMVIPNEFSIMTNTAPIISSLVPYIFADIVNIGNKFKNNLFLIDNNLFVQTFELNNRNMGIIFQFEQKDDKQAQITTIGIFGIAKNFKGEVKVLANQKDLQFINDMKKISDEQTKLFLQRLNIQ